MMNQNLISQIIYIINSILYLVIIYLMINKLRDRKKLTKKVDYIIIFILSILILILSNFYFVKIEYCIYQGLLLAFLCKKAFIISLKDSLFYSMSFSFGYSILRSIVNYISLSCIFSNIIIYSALKYKLCISIALNTILLILLKYFNKIINLDIKTKYYLYIGLTVIINIIIILFLFVAGNNILDLYEFIAVQKLYTAPGYNLGVFIITIQRIVPVTMVFCNVFLVIIINNLIKNMKSKSELRAINDKLDMQYNYYLSIQESQMKVRKLYHDINNHMACIKKIQNEDIIEYIESINEELKDFQSTFESGNRILDIILNDKNSECKKNNIDLFCDINFTKCEFIEMIDVSAIFANTLDNAIEACKKVQEDKYIKIRGTIIKSYYVIKCENSKVNEIKIKSNKIISSKKDQFLHGIGIQSIKSSLKKYDGELEMIDEKNKFTLKIYIPLRIN